MPSITYFNREQREGVYSIEELFSGIRSAISEEDWTMNDYYYPTQKGYWKAIREVHRYESQVNHITGDVNFLAYGLTPSKTLLTVHDIGHYEMTLKGWKKAVYKQLWLKGPFNRVGQLTVISEFTKKRLMHHFGIDPKKIRVIHNPSPSIFTAHPQAFNTDCPKILQIGGGHNKNVNRLLEAVHGIPCELLLIRPFDEALERKMKEYGIRHTWLSKLSYQSVADQYKACDMVFFASEYEGFGVPILEANATGRAVLTGNITAMPETAGDAACLVDPFDTQAIRKGLLKIIHEETYREELVAKGFDNVKRFRVEEMASQYVDLYQHILRQ